ncbi:hypothetical protein GXB85_11080 [Cellulomonas sp. APG4]|uniref:hypothetical protein n=1 Tax=Cellulomonas sp. APG4 TaxID=1538656 RepID=UPI00137B2A0C|nr:hypothetical protein [Cellulomonas sp. APG4]NCT91490.1 hypothetical protein [Cellulomonas sp. APG4]
MSDTGGMTVVGGAGGTAAQLEELTALARRLGGVATLLDGAHVHVRRVSRMVEATWDESPGTAAAAHGAAQSLDVGRSGLTTAATAVHALADAVARAAEAYRRAEDDALARMRRVVVAGGWALGEAGPGAWLLAGAGLRLVLPSVLLATGAVLLSGRRPTGAQLEVVTAGAAAFGLGAVPGCVPPGQAPVGRLAGAVGGGLTAYGNATGRPSTLVVAPVLGAPALRPTTAPRDLGTVVRRTAELSPSRGGPPGTVAVQRLDHADGRRTWVVAVPGTQSTSLGGGRNPLDMGSNLRLVGGRASDSSHVVRQAMERAGVEPDEPVLMVGHSQGGMAVMDVAGDPALRDRFDVAAVLTVGSPVAHQPLPADVEALHVEHVQDYVPATDGAPNPADPHRTTVHVDLTEAPSAEQRAAALSPVAAHEADLYARTVERIGALDDVSLARHEEAVARVLGDGSATGTTQLWSGTRVPDGVRGDRGGGGGF